MEKYIAPFKADITGSFVRPEQLKEARIKFDADELSLQELKEIEEDAIRDLVAKEKAIGLKSVSDGEFRRSSWKMDFFAGISGLERFMETDPESGKEIERIQLSEKLHSENHYFVQRFGMLTGITGGDVVIKQTIPSPTQLYRKLTRPTTIEATRKIYPDEEEMIEDIIAIYRKIINDFYESGCRYLQMDDCEWGALCDKAFENRAQCGEFGIEADARKLADINIAVVENKPADLVITMHISRGSRKPNRSYEAGYEPIGKELFSIPVDAFFLEFDNDRSGGFRSFAHVQNQKIILGLISPTDPELENKEDLKNRINEATKYVPIERLGLSTRSGFASDIHDTTLTEEQQWKKLELMVEVAKEIWGEL